MDVLRRQNRVDWNFLTVPPVRETCRKFGSQLLAFCQMFPGETQICSFAGKCAECLGRIWTVSVILAQDSNLRECMRCSSLYQQNKCKNLVAVEAYLTLLQQTQFVH
eukprot:329892-Rhodomonas_salina.1